MAKKSVLLVFGLFSASAYACIENNQGVSIGADSTTYDLDRELCFPLLGDSSYPANKITKPFLLMKKKHEQSDYWSDWVLKTESNPVLTQNYADNYFGVGWWSPEDNVLQNDEQTTEEWLMNHGLMFSVGFGDKTIGQPRFRLDYLWHDEDQDSVMMQVEVPF